MAKHAIFLEGPIGVGKTTLGHALADALGGAFVEADGLSGPGPWYGSILSTSRAVLAAALAGLQTHETVVIATPLRQREWVFYSRHLATAGVRPIFVSLTAPAERILDPARGRAFDAGERRRIGVMLAEGYGARDFADLTFDTSQAPLELAARELRRAVSALLFSES